MTVQPTRTAALLVAGVLTLAAAGASASTAGAAPSSCGSRTNNTFTKLLECVDLEGVREHQAAFQAIADANNGTRVSGSPGYDQSVDYVEADDDGGGLERDGSTVRVPDLRVTVAVDPGAGVAGPGRSDPEHDPVLLGQRRRHGRRDRPPGPTGGSDTGV